MTSKLKYNLLILDYGGTYSFEYELGSYNKIMATSFGRVPSADENYIIAKLSHLLAENSITVAEYVNSVAEIMNTPVPKLSVFEHATIEVTHDPSPAMKSLVIAVRADGVQVSLLSNMYLFEVEATQFWGRYDGFDYTSFSAQAGLTKSDPAFFESTLSHFGVNPDETLFVDDVVENIDVAKSLGIHTIYAGKDAYSDAQSLANAIEIELNIWMGLKQV